VSFSVNTNIASLQAQEYLRSNSAFQTKTIGRVTSGLRILSSGDDAAGLAIANGYRSDQAVLTQGIRNANDGLSQLQIIDGGLNNISKLLDRARTLATQSASGTFTGSRSVLNSEFQSVLNEIDRQAQSIGLNVGGSLARNISVFIGGGAGTTDAARISNGSVGVDLSRSTVDTASLNLQGNRISGINTTDLSAVLSNTANTASQSVSGQSQFTFRGAGFGSGVTISVDTTGSPNAQELVNRINASIVAAGDGGTTAATAFGNAKIRAAVVSDASGDQTIVFNSAGAAFQIDGGDRLSNALLGRTERNATLSATNTAAFVDIDTGSAGDDRLTFSLNGGASFNVDITSSTPDNVSKGEIVRQLNADATFSASAVAYLDANKVVIKSRDNSASSSVTVTATGLSAALGLTVDASTNNSASASEATRVQGRDRTSNLARLVGAATTFSVTVNDGTTDNLNVTVGAVTATLDVANGTYTTAASLAAALNTAISGSAVDGLVSASVINGRVALTATNPNTSVGINDAGSDNTLATAIFGASRVNTVASATEFATQDTIRFRFTGAGLSAPVDLALAQTTIGSTTVQQVIDDLRTKVSQNASLVAAGITLSTDTAGNNLVFTSKSGETFNVAVSGDSLNTLGFGSFLVGSGNAVEYTSVSGSAAYTTAFSNSGVGTARLQVSLGGGASSGNEITANLAGGDATSAAVTGSVVADGDLDLASNNTFTISVDGGTATTITITGGDNQTTQAVITTINAALTGATASLNGAGNLVITSNSKGAGSSITISNVGSAVAAELGLTAGTTRGANASVANVIDQLNDSIQGDAELRAAGLRAVESSGVISIESTNGTFFRLASRVTGSDTANLGFGNAGSSYAGPLSIEPPLVANRVNSGGANATSFLGFTAITSGADDQSVQISAVDGNGVNQSVSVTLRNDGTARTGRTIEEAIDAINAALQASSSSVLNSIVAVKDRSGAAEGIRLLSSTKNFSVQASSTINGGGISTSGGNNFTSSALAGGSSLTIDSQAGAEAAVTALAAAVAKLGDAQAVVGRGQNQFNFAVNLASSQLTNLAASESRIRDADLAAEAANLSKAQITLQAGVAALAQANSAPQAVLALLRG
jgi:flagellin